MNKEDLFNLPILTYNQIRERGHRHQGGIYKPKDEKHVRTIVTNVGEVERNYDDNLSDDLILSYFGRGRERDQTLNDYDNRALSLNLEDDVPVRVFQGTSNKYRDWGFWRVVNLDTITGEDGFEKLIYTLEPHILESEEFYDDPRNDSLNLTTTRYITKKIRMVNQQIRYAPELRELKEKYNHICQVDDEHILEGRKGKKSEVHHLDPVGPGGVLVSPNHGNEIVVCPSCHSLFDDGSIYIDPADGITVRHWNSDSKYEGKRLRLVEGHELDRKTLWNVYNKHYRKEK
ncbi:SAD/SRA domain-containing protein [Thalassobacillus cyri]|uniref:SAD/SRA domain-containing protein n=1 Tax=Thalassobacillus cyri TaxID=571932 RepID=A0A1H3VWN3_9BACI|nr:YDG/SRA domain-containing protein [Thalassobacillus cyri]SDZ79255.1 SAD/SRA domain-containing protein [Thalassobacillus cyri]